MILRCTKKALALLGAPPAGLSEAPPTDDDWYLDLIWIERKKCLQLMHAGTLFSIFVADVRKADLQPIGPYFVGLIERELRSERLPPDCLGRLDPHDVMPARTASRSILAFMNQTVQSSRYFIAYCGGLDYCDSALLNHHQRRTLHNRGEYVTPMDLVARRLEIERLNNL